MQNYRYTMDYKVRAADINYGGHVAGARVLEYLQDARLGYLKALGGFSEMSLGKNCALIIPEINIKFLAEIFLDDKLLIGTRIDELKTRSFVMSSLVERESEPAVEASIPLIGFDYELRKTRTLPAEFVEAVRKYEGM
jgi:acyl-CoA thioester hydrolase